MSLKNRFTKAILVMTPFMMVAAILLMDYTLVAEEDREEFAYTFENATIRPSFLLGELPFVVENYSNFANYTEEIYVYSKTGREEGGGFFTRSVKYPSKLYIFYINNSVMYGIVHETNYNEPIYWDRDPSTNTINVSTCNKTNVFHVEALVLGIVSELVGLVLGMKQLARKEDKKEDKDADQ